MTIKLPKIFLDSGDPAETVRAKGLIGHLDGQTTNPSLVAKNPEVQAYITSGKKLTEADLLVKYKEMIQGIEKEIAGPISVEVYADWDSTPTDMLKQAETMYTWGRNVYIKFPTIPAGLQAAHEFTKNGGRVNMTLVFTQMQAAAVYEATRPTSQPAFISPFIGRWDDRGMNGVDLVKNILKQYRWYEKTEHRESHVKVLAASIRTLDHLYASMFMDADIVTMPLKIIQEWVLDEKWVPDERYRYEPDLKGIVYEEIAPGKPLAEYPVERVEGDLLDEGVGKFVADWKNLIG
ncbi:MAG: transaldolase [Patescibacteria group bacterium]|nr:transaldolase [Patescibacteria group bacterium]